MAPRGTRRQPTTDDYSDESDMSSSKRKKKEPVEEPKDSQHVAIDEKELANAIEILKKQRDDNLLLIKTEHQMRLDSATKLAKYEEERLESFFDNEVAELKRKMLEERSQMSKRPNSDGVSRKHRIVGNHDDSGLNKDDTTLTVELPENEIVDDVRFMVSNYVAQSKERNALTVNIVVVLPGNRLLVNDLFLEPNTECYLVKDKEEMHGVFVSAEPKEFMFKPDKEKRKKYLIDGLRDGSLSISLETSEPGKVDVVSDAENLMSGEKDVVIA
ncbi:hypothetical protein WA577_000839 [Blastocystis sp. JDR]